MSGTRRKEPRRQQPRRPASRPLRPGRSTRVDPIYGRRDVALTPWIVAAVASVAAGLSEWLRADGASVDLLIMAVALGLAGFCVGVAVFLDSQFGSRFRGRLWVYLSASAGLLAVLSGAVIPHEGLASIYYAATIPLACFAGLVFPRAWSRGSLAVLVATICAVQAVQPYASALDAITILFQVIAAWIVGVLPHSAHARAARTAARLSNFEPLTQTLNRRGLIEQLEWMLSSDEPDGHIALLVIDLDQFKLLNDSEGHAAGDAMLRWVGETLPSVLPSGAEVGRLGGDEFAIILPGTTLDTALATAHHVRDALAVRIGASIGVAGSETRNIAADDLLRAADDAMYTVKADRRLGVHSLMADPSVAQGASPWGDRSIEGRPLSYAALRRTGETIAPRQPRPDIMFGWMVALCLLVVGASGAVIVVGAWLNGGTSIWDWLLVHVGPFWVASFLGLAWFSRGHEMLAGKRFFVVIYGTSALLGLGLATAMLAHGGFIAPIGAAFYLKVLFDLSVMSPARARPSVAIMLASWMLVVLLGPPSSLWAMPFQVAMLAGAYALGSIGFRAYDELTRQTLKLADTDPLTGLRNRVGFERIAEQLLEQAGQGASGFSLLVLDLDHFKLVNDTQGHAAGDKLLCAVAAVTAASFPHGTSIGRLGGDEFVVAIDARTQAEAAAQARSLTEALEPVNGASVGWAVFPSDGADLGALTKAADRRSYEAKRSRRARRAKQQDLTRRPDDDGSYTVV